MEGVIMAEENKKSYLHTMDSNLHKKIKLLCVTKGESIKLFYDKAIVNYLKKEEKA